MLCLFTLKIGLTLANIDRTACTNTFSVGWRLVIYACLYFTENTTHSTVWSFSDVVFIHYRKAEESIEMPKGA